MQRKIILGVLICVIVLASTINLAYAAPTATSGSVWTTGSTAISPAKNSFNPGETIFIHWHSEINGVPGGTVNITITDMDDNLVADVGTTEMSNSDSPKTWATSTPGQYRVVVNGKWKVAISVATVLVVPESALGTLMVIVAGFAAFGVVGVVKRNRARTASP